MKKIIPFVLGFMLILTGCGVTNLEAYCDEHPALMENIVEGAQFENLSVTIKNNSIYYDFDMTESMTSEEAQDPEAIQQLEDNMAASSDQYINIIKNLEEETGLSNVTIRVFCSYNNDIIAEQEFCNVEL